MKPAIILVTDPGYAIDHLLRVVTEVATAIGPGALMVQLRDKTSPAAIVRAHAQRLHEVTKRTGSFLVLNGIRKRSGQILDIVEELEIDGIHVKTSDIPAARTGAKWVSVPTHTDRELHDAAFFGADAALVSPIFLTPGKGMPRGPQVLKAWTPRPIALYALGGVTPKNVAMCAQAGAHGVAVVRALLDADELATDARALAAPFRQV